MKDAAIVELDERGVVNLPEEIRQDLPPGTHFLARREEQTIILLALPQDASRPFDLSAQAFAFANELIGEEYDDYLLQAALAERDQEP